MPTHSFRLLLNSSAIAMLVLTMALLVGTSAIANDDKDKSALSASDGVFSNRQASRGARKFATACLGCHRVEDIQPKWFLGSQPKTVGDMFQQLVTTMPDGNPGSLSPTEYADILAYVLREKEFPAGEQDLPADVEALKKIGISLH